MSTTLDPGLESYLRTNRRFMAPAVAAAVSSLGLSRARSILDAGTGAGGALEPLTRAGADDVQVRAVDLNPGVVALAERTARQAGIVPRVRFQVGDVAGVLDEAANAGGAFDAIWASDLVWPGNFADPAELVRHMAAALAPGGVVALFYSNYYQAMFLPGHSRLERKLRTASELRWGLPGSGPTHYERHVAWLVSAGLHDVDLRIFPRVGFPTDADPDVRTYLEAAVLPELLASAVSCGADAGMTHAEVSDVRRLLSPDSPAYVLDEPGYYVVHPAILACGRRPAVHDATEGTA